MKQYPTNDPRWLLLREHALQVNPAANPIEFPAFLKYGDGL
jgi:hypothetical protein